MRIEGSVGDDGAILVPAFLTIPILGIAGKSIIFEVDTGASRTMILQRDAEKIGVDYEKLEKNDVKTITGIGGGADVYSVPKAILQFRDIVRSGWLAQVEMKEIYILHNGNTKSTREAEDVMNLPSLMGRDLLGNTFVIESKRDKATIDV